MSGGEGAQPASFALATSPTGRIPAANSRVESVRGTAALDAISAAGTAAEGVIYPELGE